MSNEKPPDTFWKYFGLDDKSWSTTLSAIAGRYFWMADPSSFGDAIDNPWSFSKRSRLPLFFYHNDIASPERIQPICDEIQAKRKREKDQKVPWMGMDRNLYNPIVNRVLEFYEGNYKKNYEEDFYDLQSLGDDEAGVLSFSDSPFNQYLWDKYASGHQGFCLGFELTERHRGRLEKVQYEDDRPLRFDLCEVLRSPGVLCWDSLFVKNSKFSAENEWRLFRPIGPRLPLFDEIDRGRKFREFRLTECILGIGFPSNLVDVLTAVLPPHVVMGKVNFSYWGEDEGAFSMGFGSGYPSYYRAGRDRKILDRLNSQQTLEIEPEEYETGREEGYSQIRSEQLIDSDFPERKPLDD